MEMELSMVTFVLKDMKDRPIAVFRVPEGEVDNESFINADATAGHYLQVLDGIQEFECGSMGDLVRKIEELNGG